MGGDDLPEFAELGTVGGQVGPLDKCYLVGELVDLQEETGEVLSAALGLEE